MTITNKSDTDIVILDKVLNPGETKRYNVKNECLLLIEASNGCCKIIVTIDGKVKIQNNGALKARFAMKKDRDGYKNINIISV